MTKAKSVAQFGWNRVGKFLFMVAGTPAVFPRDGGSGLAISLIAVPPSEVWAKSSSWSNAGFMQQPLFSRLAGVCRLRVGLGRRLEFRGDLPEVLRGVGGKV